MSQPGLQRQTTIQKCEIWNKSEMKETSLHHSLLRKIMEN